MAFKMKGPSLLKMVSALKQKDKYPTEEDKKFLKEQREESVQAMDYLTKTPVGPRAIPKPFDRKKFEEENKIEHDVEAKMDEYPPKFFHTDIKKKNK